MSAIIERIKNGVKNKNCSVERQVTAKIIKCQKWK